jgi:lysozyme
MDIQKLKEELTLDEGCEFKLYNDHLGYKTFGVGHLVTKDDPEYEMEIGEEVSEDRVHECFVNDVEKVIEDCLILYYDFYDLPEEAQLIIANMMFNMGRPRLSKFQKMKRAVDNREWEEASNQMKDSKWYEQVPNRANRLVERMRNV